MAKQLDLFGPRPESDEPLPSSTDRRGRLLTAPGPRAVERVLCDEIEACLAAAGRDPAALARPVRIVVPSRSLRLHVAAALVRRRGRSVAGVVVQTLFGAALEILERSGEPVARGSALFEILARRAARAEPALRRGLDDLIEGYGAAAATLRDLLDAGLEPAHVSAADEILAAEGRAVAPAADVERARALVRAAGASAAALDRLGAGRTSDLLRRAADRLLTRPDVLPARAVYVHGFADATGAASDLLEALVRALDAAVLVDLPPARAEALAGDAGALPGQSVAPREERAFAARLLARIADSTGPPSALAVDAASGEASRLDAFAAIGADAEARTAARRIGDLIAAGVEPERIGVVARDLAAHRFPLRRHFDRLGVPCSGLGATGGLTAPGRRLRALEELLRRRMETPVSRWLDALFGLPGVGRPGFDLRLALAALGAGRLRDAAALDLATVLDEGEESYPLPIRHGFSAEAPDARGDAAEDDGGDDAGNRGGTAANGGPRVPRRRLRRTVLESALAAARRLGVLLEGWPEEAPASEHFRRLRALLVDHLGWNPTERDLTTAFSALDDLAAELPGGLAIALDELRLLARTTLGGIGAAPLGGAGGGVQVLSVTEARGRTFDHLFVLGLNRDVFPRPIREDPLLPDALRAVLRRLLPDVPSKRAGFDEERYLFAQLLAAAPAVTLSWQKADEDGRERPLSPLVERLGLASASDRPVPSLYAAAPEASPSAQRARPAFEHAVLAGLHGGRERFAAALPAAVEEALADLAELHDRRAADATEPAERSDPSPIARARAAALDEIDPDLRTSGGRAIDRHLGPWFGWIGALSPPAEGDADPRRQPLAVTHLERLAGCPWQFFLTRLLKLEPTPDPLQALPGLDARLLGNLVHAVLDAVANGGHPSDRSDRSDRSRPSQPNASKALRTLDAVRARLADLAGPIAWPDDAELAAILARESGRLVAEEGIALPGLSRALAARAAPYLVAARAELTGPPAPAVAASEVQGEVEVAGPGGRLVRLGFRADRADLRADGTLLLTDYKTGRPVSDKQREENRRAEFVKQVRAGAKLQAVAYRRAAGPGGEGRYYFLRPDLDERFRTFSATADDADLDAAFDRAVAAGLAVHAAGSFFPRVVEPDGEKEPRRCEYCEVAEACLRGDSGARRRLFEWASRRRDRGGEPAATETPAESALLALWSLASGEPEKGG